MAVNFISHDTTCSMSCIFLVALIAISDLASLLWPPASCWPMPSAPGILHTIHSRRLIFDLCHAVLHSAVWVEAFCGFIGDV